MDKDYKLAEHLIKHLQQDADLAAMVCPTVWDDQDQVDAINRVAIGKPGSVAVTPAGYVPLLEMGVDAPMVRIHSVLAVSCFACTTGMLGGMPPLRYLSVMVGRSLRAVRKWDPVVDRVCYDMPSLASVEDYDMSKSKLTGYRGKAIILYAPVNF